jgi:hypothetical protein
MAKTTQFYQETCDYYGTPKNDSSADAWEVGLGQHRLEDVARAIQEWESRTDINPYTRRAMGASMPKVADLKNICERLSSERAVSKKFESCGKCCEGNVMVEVWNERAQRSEEVATSCECRIQWVKARKALA